LLSAYKKDSKNQSREGTLIQPQGIVKMLCIFSFSVVQFWSPYVQLHKLSPPDVALVSFLIWSLRRFSIKYLKDFALITLNDDVQLI